LELLYHARPSVILYQVSRFGYFVQSLFRRCRYITLVNLLTADDITTDRPAAIYDRANPRDAHVLMPEYLTCEDKSEQLAAHCIEWLKVSEERSRHIAKLVRVRDQFAAGGASERAAEYIAGVVQPAARPSRQAA
jgi:lipid-A-disaccharide synthase